MPLQGVVVSVHSKTHYKRIEQVLEVVHPIDIVCTRHYRGAVSSIHLYFPSA